MRLNAAVLIFFSVAETLLLKGHLDKLSSLGKLIEKEKSGLIISPELGARIKALVEYAIAGDVKWKDIQKGFDDEEYQNLDLKTKEKKQKDLASLLKGVVSLESKMDEERSAIKDLAQNKTAIYLYAQDLLRKWEQKEYKVTRHYNKVFIAFESKVNNLLAPESEGANRIHLNGSWTMEQISPTRVRVTYKVLSKPVGIPKAFADPFIRNNFITTFQDFIALLEKTTLVQKSK